jgi:putative sporulation protein YyaC
MNFFKNNEVYYIDETSKSAVNDLSNTLLELMGDFSIEKRDLVFLCIGSDRVTGDSLGPMIGHHLKKHSLFATSVYGTLTHPVHALNLVETIAYIHDAHPNCLLIAIDASLGSKKHLGYITLGQGSLKPGAGVHKKLPPVGDIFITGIINTTGTFEHLILQTTRLATIMRISDCITSAIIIASQKYHFNTR